MIGMAKPKLRREDRDDIRRMYADRTRNIGVTNLKHLFRVSEATIHKVLDGKYIPLEDYEEKKNQGDANGSR